MTKKYMIDDEFQVENNLKEYEDSIVCVDCDDGVIKLTKCIGWDGVYFCEKHWEMHRASFLESKSELIPEPFFLSRKDLIHNGVLSSGDPSRHKKSNS